jgi:hypothetical protein
MREKEQNRICSNRCLTPQWDEVRQDLGILLKSIEWIADRRKSGPNICSLNSVFFLYVNK